jgi:hypothetical protein
MADDEKVKQVLVLALEMMQDMLKCTSVLIKACSLPLSGTKRCRRTTNRDGFLVEKMKLSDDGFHDSFRMSKSSFMKIRAIVNLPAVAGGNISNDELLACAIYFLAHGSNQRRLEEVFGISKSHLQKRVLEILVHIIEALSSSIDFQGNTEDIQDEWIRNESFEPFRGVIGALDGTLVPYVAREEGFGAQTQWYSRKGFTSINCVVICDARKRICRFAAGMEGSAHDENALQHTDFLDTLPARSYLLADAGYALRERLVLPPHRGTRYHLQEFGDVSRRPQSPEEYFNLKHSSLRITVEMCIGLLKGKWKVLTRGIDSDFKNMRIISYACVCLHNFLIDVQDGYRDEIHDEDSEDEEEDGTRRRRIFNAGPENGGIVDEENMDHVDIPYVSGDAWRNVIMGNLWESYQSMISDL